MKLGFLDRLLATLEVDVTGFALCEVSRGVALMLPPAKAPILHYVLKGRGVVLFDNGPELSIRQHDFFLAPPGRGQVLRVARDQTSRAQGPESCIALVDGMLRMRANPQGRSDLVTACGLVEPAYAGSLGFLAGIEEPLIAHAAEGRPLRQAIDTLLGELLEPQLGTHALTEALLKQCLILLIRECAADPERLTCLFEAVNPDLLRPLMAMIEHPAHDFSLEALARLAGMSRSGFAAQFHASFGQPPIEFLRSIRLRRAARLLERTDVPVAMIATSVGYESRTYFSRAFRAEFGIDPRGYRDTRRSTGRGR